MVIGVHLEASNAQTHTRFNWYMSSILAPSFPPDVLYGAGPIMFHIFSLVVFSCWSFLDVIPFSAISSISTIAL